VTPADTTGGTRRPRLLPPQPAPQLRLRRWIKPDRPVIPASSQGIKPTVSGVPATQGAAANFMNQQREQGDARSPESSWTAVTIGSSECHGCETHAANQHPSTKRGHQPPTASEADPLAVIQTNTGNNHDGLFRSLHPQKTVANFIDLAQKGFGQRTHFSQSRTRLLHPDRRPKRATEQVIMSIRKPSRHCHVPLGLNPRLRHNAAGVAAMARFGTDPNSAKQPVLHYACSGRLI